MAKRRNLLNIDGDRTPQPVRTGGDNWDLCVQAFIDSMTLRNLSWYTKRHHKHNLKSMSELLNHASPIKLTTDDLKKAIIKMFDRKLSPTTINHHIRTSQQFFAFLTLEGYLLEDPAKPP